MRIPSNLDSSVSTFPQSSRSLVSFVEIFRVTHVQFLHKKRYSIFRHLGDKEVVMITHQTKGVDINKALVNAALFQLSFRLLEVKRRRRAVERE